MARREQVRENESRMCRAILLSIACAAGLTAASWTEYRIGPLRVISDAGDNAARERLTEAEQIRYVLGNMLGTTDAKAIWPITTVLFDNEKDAATHALSQAFVEGGSANLSVAHKKDAPAADWRRGIVRQLLDATQARLPAEFETALADLFSTIRVDGTRVWLGGELTPGSVTPERRRAWARLHYLAATVDNAGRFKTYLSSYASGDAAVAAHNAYGVDADVLEQRMNAHADAGVFEALSVFGKAMNPAREFYERRLPASEVDPLLAELKAPGQFPPRSARALLAEGTRESLRAAAAANPLWGEPHARLAALEQDPLLKIERLKLATEAEPRVLAYWEALAEAQTAAALYTDAARTWVRAERATASPRELVELRAKRRAIDEKRVESELAASRRARDEREAHEREVQEQSMARIQAAVDAANRELAAKSTPSDAPTVAFSEINSGVPRVVGQLTRVDCIGGMFRLSIQPDAGGELIKLRMAAPPEGAPPPACGTYDPPKRIEATHDAKPDTRLATVGDILTFEIK